MARIYFYRDSVLNKSAASHGECVRYCDSIMKQNKFNNAFQGFDQTYSVKTAPKGFSKEDSNIDLIKLKSYFVVHKFTDAEVFSAKFKDNLVAHFLLLRPFFDYMSEVLTTDLNGVSTIDR